MLQSLSSMLNAAGLATRLNQVVFDDNLFLGSNNKREFLESRGAKIDRRILDQYELVDMLCPSLMINTFRSALVRVKEQNSIASIISVEQEIPITTGSGMFEEILQNSMKAAISVVFTESDIRKFYEYAESGSVPNEVYMAIFKNISSIQGRIHRLFNKLFWQAVFTGRIDHVDSRSNAAVTVKYDINEDLFPAPLTGADSWDRYDTARALDNLIQHQELHYEINGYYPQKVVIRKKLLNHIARQRSTAEMALSMGLLYNVPTGTNALISTEHINKILESNGYGQLVVYDARYTVETLPRKEIQVPYCPDHSYAFVNDNMAEKLWTPTVEGLGVPGIYINNDPRERKDNEAMSKGVANAIISFKKSTELGARRVIAAA
jgi:hypothetical protein